MIEYNRLITLVFSHQKRTKFNRIREIWRGNYEKSLANLAFVTLAAGALLTSSSAKASAITSRMTENDGQAVIELTGEIIDGDSVKVANLIKYWNNRDVRVSGIRLNSRGGNVIEAENIATLIRNANMASVIGRHQVCYSACTHFCIWKREMGKLIK